MRVTGRPRRSSGLTGPREAILRHTWTRAHQQDEKRTGGRPASSAMERVRASTDITGEPHIVQHCGGRVRASVDGHTRASNSERSSAIGSTDACASLLFSSLHLASLRCACSVLCVPSQHERLRIRISDGHVCSRSPLRSAGHEEVIVQLLHVTPGTQIKRTTQHTDRKQRRSQAHRSACGSSLAGVDFDSCQTKYR